MAVTINEDLIKAGVKYKKELLAMPVAVLSEIFPYVTLVTGLQGKTVGGIITVDGNLRPYKSEKGATDGVAISKFEWETYKGDVVKEFDPSVIMGSLYTEPTATKPTDMQFAKRVAMEVAKKVGEGLYDVLWIAKRNANGTTSEDLFDGWYTILKAKIADGTLAVANKNFVDNSSVVLSADNVGDVLKAFWRGADPKLKKLNTNLNIPQEVLEMYEDWYQTEYGHVPFNTQFEQKTLIGTNGKCTLVPWNNMSGVTAITLTVKDNKKIGVDQVSDVESVEIRRPDNPKMVQFYMIAFFGVGYETFDRRFFRAMRVALDPVADFANSAVAATTATFTWTAADAATSLKIQVSTDGGTTWADATHTAIAVDAATKQVTGLTAATAYKFRLLVVDGANNGYSNVVTVTTTA